MAEFPGVDHEMRGFSALPDGTRLFTHYAPGYFPLIADFAAGTQAGPGAYPDAIISEPR